MDHPEVIAIVDEQAADVAEDPVVRQRRRPRRIDLVDRQLVGGRRPRGGLGVRALRVEREGQERAEGQEHANVRATRHGPGLSLIAGQAGMG